MSLPTKSKATLETFSQARLIDDVQAEPKPFGKLGKRKATSDSVYSELEGRGSSKKRVAQVESDEEGESSE